MAEVNIQQGESGGALAPVALGTFRVGNAEPGSTVECHLSVTSEGDLQFRAAQNGQRLPVAWRPPQQAAEMTA